MDTPYPLWLFVIGFLILVNVFFALAETSLNESHKSKLEKMQDDGDEEATKALKLLEKPERALAVIQLGITFVSILIGVCTSVILAPCIHKYLYLMPYSQELSLRTGGLVCSRYRIYN